MVVQLRVFERQAGTVVVLVEVIVRLANAHSHVRTRTRRQNPILSATYAADVSTDRAVGRATIIARR